jgi:septum formation protein
MSESPKIVLASSSPYRRSLLERLCIPFDTASPDVDESPLPGETPEQLVIRLACLKAGAVAKERPSALVVGSDQVAVLGNTVLGKPGNRANALKQLQSMRGHTVSFLTGLCLLNTTTNNCQTDLVRYEVVFREYDDAEIERYLDRDQPYNCAGSFKSEQLGITLMRRMQGEDPTALIGLPLIRLAEMLRQEAIQLP